MKQVAVLGAALDLGTTRRGVDMGPSAIRYAGLAERLESLGLDVVDRGNVLAEIPEVAAESNEHARYLPAILATCAQIAARVADIARSEQMPLVLGGDHSIAMGTLAGLAAAHGPGGVLWIDAHGDLNRPETSPTGNVHGMPLATALGRCGFGIEGFSGPPWVEASHVALVGIRSLDPGEKELVRELDLAVFTMADIDRRGMPDVMKDAIAVVEGASFVHLSLDVDVCDPEIAPGVGTPVRGGLSYREAHLAMEIVAESELLTSLEIVEVNPILDHADETGALAVELAASALGARIL
ncbi:MAG TPA: arginase [Actinomycetota bacterium]|nr:arginase [Actinomycetota bacterium]